MLCHENPRESWVVQLQRDGYYEQMGIEIRQAKEGIQPCNFLLRDS